MIYLFIFSGWVCWRSNVLEYSPLLCDCRWRIFL